MVNKIIKWVLILTLLLAGGWLFYTKVYIPKSTYNTTSAIKGDMNITVFGIATVGARYKYPVSSNYGGKVIALYKDQGEWIKKGELIARFDPLDMPQQLDEAKAKKMSANYGVISAQKQLQSLKAQLHLAQLNYDRYSRLQKQGFAAKIEYDKAVADLESIKAQIASNEAQIRSQKAQKRQAEHSIKALKTKIERLNIYSPVDGYIISRNAEISQNIAPQQPVVTIVKSSDVWVRATIDERISGDIRVGQRAVIHLRSRSNKMLLGKVSKIEPQSDPVTEERIVDIAFDVVPNPFYINEQAEVSIIVDRLNSVLQIPSKLIQKGGVWVYNSGKAHFKKVKILGRSGDMSAVDGLKEGEMILIPDSHKKPLFEGAGIHI